MFSITQVLPEDLAITSVTTFGSTPKPSAMRNASLTATAATPAMRLLQSLATSPLPTGPTWITLAPMASSTGLAAWKSSAAAPTMMASVPSVARGGPPRHRRVHEAYPALRRRRGHAARGGGIHGGHVDAERAPAGRVDDPAVAAVDLLHVRRGRQHGHHDLGAGHRLRGGGRRRHPRGGRRLQGLRVDVVGDDGEAFLDEVGRHGQPHGADADEPDACHARSPDFDRSSMPAHSSMSRATAVWSSSPMPRATAMR